MTTLKLKNLAIALFVLSMLIISTNTFAQTNTNANTKGKAAGTTNKATLQHGPRFVDANGDGICDNALDTNNDGKPDGCGNAQRPMDGTGKKNGMGKGHGMGLKGGAQGSGTGVCDGTGPKGRMSGK